MPNVTLLQLTSSMARNLRILFPLLTIVMYVFLVVFMTISQCSFPYSIGLMYNTCVCCRSPMLIVQITSLLTSLRMDLYISILQSDYFLLFFDQSIGSMIINIILYVSLLTENGNTKDDLRLPTDENLLTQVSKHLTAHPIFQHYFQVVI